MRKFYRQPLIGVVLVGVLAGAFVIAAKADKAAAPAVSDSTAGAQPAAKADAGLLIIAHGAPMPAWNKPVLALEEQIIEALGDDSPFKKVKVVMMEFATPTVADGVREMELAGCSRIVAVPLLIAPSSHSHWDIPALLGIYSDEEITAELAAEGAAVVRSKLPITVTATLDHGDLLLESMLARVMELSSDPSAEAVVVLAHGDEGLKPYWDALMKRITHHVCGKTGITYADWAYVHVGQGYAGEGVGAIAAATRRRKRVLLVGCYVSMGPAGMHGRYMNRPTKIHGILLPNPLEGKDIVAAKHGLLPDPRLAKHLAKIARAAVIKE